MLIYANNNNYFDKIRIDTTVDLYHATVNFRLNSKGCNHFRNAGYFLILTSNPNCQSKKF